MSISPHCNELKRFEPLTIFGKMLLQRGLSYIFHVIAQSRDKAFFAKIVVKTPLATFAKKLHQRCLGKLHQKI